MNSVILITPEGYYLKQFIDRVRTRNYIISEKKDHCVIQSGTYHAIINRDNSIRFNYDEEELLVILSNISNPEFFMFEFNEFAFGKEVLVGITKDPSIMVDDDHGQILNGVEFSLLLSKNPGIDWRW